MNDLCHLTLKKPPEILFFATNADLCDQVYKQGLKRQNSPFIEVYATYDEARRKFGRRKLPSMFAIVARVMAEDGYTFCQAETGEWLVDEIPPRYIRLQ